jgi:hypothetical protein
VNSFNLRSRIVLLCLLIYSILASYTPSITYSSIHILKLLAINLVPLVFFRLTFQYIFSQSSTFLKILVLRFLSPHISVLFVLNRPLRCKFLFLDFFRLTFQYIFSQSSTSLQLPVVHILALFVLILGE